MLLALLYAVRPWDPFASGFYVWPRPDQTFRRMPGAPPPSFATSPVLPQDGRLAGSVLSLNGHVASNSLGVGPASHRPTCEPYALPAQFEGALSCCQPSAMRRSSNLRESGCSSAPTPLFESRRRPRRWRRKACCLQRPCGVDTRGSVCLAAAYDDALLARCPKSPYRPPLFVLLATVACGGRQPRVIVGSASHLPPALADGCARAGHAAVPPGRIRRSRECPSFLGPLARFGWLLHRLRRLRPSRANQWPVAPRDTAPRGVRPRRPKPAFFRTMFRCTPPFTVR